MNTFNMKTLFLGLVIATVLSVASSAALTAGNLLVSRKAFDTNLYTRLYVDEITTSGTVVQTFDPNCLLLRDPYSGGLSFNEDYTSSAFVCYPNSGTPDPNGPKIAVAIQANGTMDTTTISDAITGLEPYCAFVDGRSVWVGTDSSTIVYAKRNGDVIFSDVVTTTGSATLDIQMQSGAFYIGGYTDSPYLIASVIGGAPKTVSNAKNFISGSDIVGGSSLVWNRFWFYSFSEAYATAETGGVVKLTQSGGQWTLYQSPSVSGTLGLVVQNVGNKRMVYITTTLEVISFEDDGTQFLNKVVIKTYSSPTTLLDVIYINAPKGACGDGIKNLDETDVDCGGYSCDLCANNKGCQSSDDCASSYCNPTFKCCKYCRVNHVTCNICDTFKTVPSCQDTFQNQDETDADCGGSTCTNRCADTKRCFMDSDCANNYCNPAKKCATPSCSDGIQNQGETDVDCGGPNCPSCADGKACSTSDDCQSQYCNPQGKCSTASCSDGFVNQNETDVDCGGFSCPPCQFPKICRSDSDCATNWCNSGNVCDYPTCTDGLQNYPETDVDCGGTCPSKCMNGKSCSKDSDCLGGTCTSNICEGSLCTDNIMDGLETDVDCGGGECNPCGDGKTCKKNSDCESNDCDSVKNVCNASTPAATSPESASPTSSSTPSSATPSGKVVSSSNKLSGASYFIAAMLFVVQWMC